MHTTSLSLLGRIRIRDDQASWKDFVQLYAPLLYRWNRTAGMQSADAQEVVQEVLLFVHERIGRFRWRRPGAFRAWLRAVTQNKARELRRRRRRDDRIGAASDSLDGQPDPRSDFAWADRYAEDLLDRACEMARPFVDDKTWRVFMRVYREHVPAEAVAREFGITRNMVYVAQCRCLAKVRLIVGRYLDDAMQAPLHPVPATVPVDAAAL